jgi:hypothetical protein
VGAAPPYPEGVPPFERYVINEYNTVGHRIKPPFTSIVKYDLNEPAIKWRIGFGDDPDLAARYGCARLAQRHHRHGIRARVRRRPRQSDLRLGQRDRPSALGVSVRW